MDDGSKETGQRVVICGGGLTGIETAIQLGREGKDVTVVDMIPARDFIKNKFYIIRNSILAEAEKAGVKMIGDSKVLKFDREGVYVDCLGKEKMIPADSIVLAFGTKPENGIYDEIYPLKPLNIYKIGDCNKVANIMNAVQSGYDVAYDL